MKQIDLVMWFNVQIKKKFFFQVNHFVDRIILF